LVGNSSAQSPDRPSSPRAAVESPDEPREQDERRSHGAGDHGSDRDGSFTD
jgi:hypothetical protein